MRQEEKNTKTKNVIIYIGYLGGVNCYLNIPEEEAIKRYCKEYDININEFNKKEYNLRSIEFDDEFEAYDIWVK